MAFPPKKSSKKKPKKSAKKAQPSAKMPTMPMGGMGIGLPKMM